MLFDFRKDAVLAKLVIEQHIFLTTPYSLLWAQAHKVEKGRVERAIRYIRSAFFAARQFRDIADLNAQADAWCAGQAMDRPCPQDKSMSVREAFLLEQPHLLGLPDEPFPSDEVLVVKAGKTPYVRFDLNDYSIPYTHVQRSLTVRASCDEVRVFDGALLLSRLGRSYDKGAQVEEPAHIAELTLRKREARRHRGMDRLAHAAPASAELLLQAAKRNGNLGTITAALLRLLERFGAVEIEAAIVEALSRGAPHPNAVRLALERRREERHQAPPVATILSEHAQARDVAVQAHRLDTYDQLTREHTDEQQT